MKKQISHLLLNKILIRRILKAREKRLSDIFFASIVAKYDCEQAESSIENF